MNSSMIATDPIPDASGRRSAGRAGKPLGDTAHGFFYAQRTVDDRIAIGGRSVPYRYGSRTDRDGRVPERTITHLTATLHVDPSAGPRRADRPRLVRRARRARATGRPASSLDKATGLGWAGGYVGHGVTATNLAAARWRTWCSISAAH